MSTNSAKLTSKTKQKQQQQQNKTKNNMKPKQTKRIGAWILRDALKLRKMCERGLNNEQGGTSPEYCR